MGQQLNTYNQRLDTAIRNLDSIRDITIIVSGGLSASTLSIAGYQYLQSSADEASDGLWKVDLALAPLGFITPLKTPVALLTKGVKKAKQAIDKADEKLDEVEEKKDDKPDEGEEEKTLLDKVSETLGIATIANNLVRDGLTLNIQKLETASEATDNFKTAIAVAMERGGVAWQGKYDNLNTEIEAQLALRNAETVETNNETSDVSAKFNDLKAIFAAIDFPSINEGIVAIQEFASYFAALAKPLDVAAALLKPIQPLFDAADLIISIFVDPVVDFVIEELGMQRLVDFANELVDTLTLDFDGIFDALSNLLQDYKDFILDLAETGLGMIPLLDKIEAAHFGNVVGNADEGPTGWGTAFGQTVTGDAGDDILDGLAGDDTIQGLAGNDVIIGGEGSDSLEGGTGDDLFYFDASFTEYELFREDEPGDTEEATGDIHVSHVAPISGGTNTGIDTIKAIEDGDHVVFTDISFTGEELRNAIFGGSVLTGTNNDDLIFLRGTGDTVNSFFVANGLDGDDRIFGSTQNDRLNGGRGNDLLLPGKGDDQVNGNAGIDTYQVLAGENRELAIDLVVGSAFGQGQDTLTSIENIIASPDRNHEILGSNAANSIFTGDGIDVISGRGGNDLIHSGGEDDYIIGGQGSDTINAGGGTTDVMISGSRAVRGESDLYIGGEGYDMVSYTSSSNTIKFDVNDQSDTPSILNDLKNAMVDLPDSGPVRINGENGTIVRYDAAGNRVAMDRTEGVEGFMGSDMDDQIYGGAQASVLHGADGNDTIWSGGTTNINGGGGDDLILPQFVEGGATALQIGGGAGFDTLDLAQVGEARWFYKIEGSISLQLRAVDVTAEGDNLQNNGNYFFSIKPRGIEELILGDNDDHVIFAPGGSADFILQMNDGDDRYDGKDGFAEVFAGDGDDRGNFTSGSGIFHGEGGDDYALFREGDDDSQALMGEGNDFLQIKRFDGHADGGDGYDSISFEVGLSSRIVVNTAAGTIESFKNSPLNFADLVDMTLSNFEEMITTRFDDFIDGRSADEVFITRGGADTVRARDGDDKVYGGGGNDSLWGGNGNDLLHGGAGNDILLGGNGNDTASYSWSVQDGEEGELTAGNFGSVDVSLIRSSATGAFGRDTLNGIENVIGSGGDDRIQGSTTDNLLSGGDGDDTLFGLGGDDILLTGGGDDLVFGGAADDIIVVGVGDKTLYGGTGTDTLDFGTLEGSMTLDFATGTYTALLSTPLPRWLQRDLDGDGTNESNGIEARMLNGVLLTPQEVLETQAAFANSADDLIRELPDEDDADFAASLVQLVNVTREASGTFVEFEDVLGGRSADMIVGDSAANSVSGALGNDTLTGNAGADTLSGGLGADELYGGNDNDILNGNGGRDTLKGNNGNDDLFGELGKDDINGGSGNDKVSGGGGTDLLNGGGGNDKLKGGGGKDDLRGGDGADNLNGGSGADTLDGGAGNDTLAGGKGIDDFVFGNNDGNDTIRDFDALDGREDIDLGDVTRITNFTDLRNNHMSQQGDDVIINDFNGTRIVLEDVRLNQLDAGDFLF